ncbi:ABC transporter permease [Nitrincola tibetensis]|uniref:ABC transporter permease n=1 Tax=Nitrincola tibetensis TaxID=2219697 RepID=A0A364NK51_9GAMM|nr:ABC transporter permease [Nitrincola tibetensis]RAU17411.1 ABC transporter permease [Nitrincola tibetensis]
MLKLALLSIWNRRGTIFLTLLTLSISVTLLMGVEKLRHDTKQSFFNTVSGTDLIVGARSGSLPLLLYSVFGIGQPTNNIRWSSYQQIASQEAVAWTIPITLGDSHQGFKVIGTENSFYEHFKFGRQQSLSMAEGHFFDDLFDVVLGAEVARALGYQLDDAVVIAHGLGRGSFAQHQDKPFKVSGILNATGTPIDRNLFISLAAWEAIHIDWRAGTRIPGMNLDADAVKARDLTPKELTAFMVGLQSPMATFHMQRAINTYRTEPLQAILPGVALQELWQVLSIAEKSLLIVSACVIFASLTGMLGILLTSLNERRRELAILRAVGAGPLRIMVLLLSESVFLTLLASALGVGMMYLLVFSFQDWIALEYGVFLTLNGLTPEQVRLLLWIQLAGLITGLIPAIKAYYYTLIDGLTPKI